jgi:hypothetical protein
MTPFSKFLLTSVGLLSTLQMIGAVTFMVGRFIVLFSITGKSEGIASADGELIPDFVGLSLSPTASALKSI